jgi:APA family basic amino acid/polyamine antiporter
MMGNMIGVGIFIYPVMIASHLPHPLWFLLIWVLGGLIALTGALSSAELGTFFPEAGGDYAYLRNVYGKRWAFLYGFLTFFITFPGSIALGVGLTVHYQGESLLGPWVREVAFSLFGDAFQLYYYQIISCILVLFLTIVNHFGVHSSFLLQRIVTLVPIVFLVLICVLSLSFISYDFFINSTFNPVLSSNLSLPMDPPEMLELGAALVPVYWTFSGWNSPLALGAEIENPHKTIPRAMIFGPMLVTLIYLLFSFVFIAVVPYVEFRKGGIDPYLVIGNFFLKNLNVDATTVEYLPRIISLIIFLVVLGNTNSAMLTGSRIYVAMARDKLFWEQVGHIDPKRNSPTTSLWLQSAWAILLILFISKESNLLNFSFIAITLLSVLTIFSIFMIRLKNIQIARLYKTYGYPYTPILYIFSSLLILILIILGYVQEGKYSILLSAVLAVLFGLVGFELWKKYKLSHGEE